MNNNESKIPQAYYHGKFFDSVEEMWAYALEWATSQVSKESIEFFCKALADNLWLNMQIRKQKITNSEALKEFETILFILIEKFEEKNKSEISSHVD